MSVSLVTMDIAKNVFHVGMYNRAGKVVKRRRLRRDAVLRFFTQLEANRVVMEACSGAHYWAREFQAMGHQVRLLPPRAVAAFVLGVKNDYRDTDGLRDADSSPSVHAVAVKSVEQHDWQMLHRLREAVKRQRTALVNRLRGLLSEYGVVIPQGVSAARRGFAQLLEEGSGLSAPCRELLGEEYAELCRLDERLHSFDRRIGRLGKESETVRRLREVPGIGPLLSSALPAHMGNARQFRHARELSACIGLVPHQHSTGGRARLLGISKRGDPYLRSLFVNGARSVLSHAPGKDDRLSRWAVAVAERRGFNKAVVALANKLARIAWVVLARGVSYQAG